MKEEEVVHHFDVLKEMGLRGLDVRVTPLSNVVTARRTRGGAELLIYVRGKTVILGLGNNAYVGGLVLADAKQFEKVKKELEALTEALDGEGGEEE